MTTVTTDVGRNYIANVAIGTIDEIAVGNGTTSPAESDTSLDSELYRATENDSNVAVKETSGTADILGRISISGGTEVPAGSDITEFGLFLENGSTMVYREVRSAVTLQAGDTKTFEFTVKLID